MVCWYTLLWRNVAEHSFLLVIVAAHSLVSMDFLHSDEFFELKLQRKCIFQQTARSRVTNSIKSCRSCLKPQTAHEQFCQFPKHTKLNGNDSTRIRCHASSGILTNA